MTRATINKCIPAMLLFLSCTTAIAQPRYSPEERARKDTQWMKDSLQLAPDKTESANKIATDYYVKMDKAAGHTNKKQLQEALMRKKDKQMQALLNKEQYQRYYKREKNMRHTENIIYKGNRQPY